MRKLLILGLRLAAVVGGLHGFQVLCLYPYRCSQVLAEVEARSHRALRSPDPSAAALIARGNLALLEQVHEGCREDIAWHMMYAGNCRLLGRDEQAVLEYSRALALNQRPEIYLQRGLTKLSLGRTEDAIPDLATAARFNPNVIYDLSGETQRRVLAAIQ